MIRGPVANEKVPPSQDSRRVGKNQQASNKANVPLRGVRAIFFDAVGTLIHADPSAVQVYADAGRRFGSRHNQADIARRFQFAFQQEETIDRTLGLRTSEEREWHRWRAIVAHVLDDVHDSEGAFAFLHRYFAQPQAWKLNQEAVFVLRHLRASGCMLGMISNFDRRLREVAAGWPELAPLEHLIISSEVGWRKPAAEIFGELCRRTGLLPQQVLVVGDDPVNDYDGALASGLHGVLFDPTDKYETVAGGRVRQLCELCYP
jgi:putative hydrolase of the HAD superfamily